jgi:hypothetical protein
MIVCAKCGEKITPGGKFCPTCGTKIETESSSITVHEHDSKAFNPLIPTSNKRKKIIWIAIIGALIVFAISQNGSSQNGSTTDNAVNSGSGSSTDAQAMGNYLRQVRSELNMCNNSALVASIQLSTILSNPSAATSSDYVSLALYGKEGAANCAMFTNDGVYQASSNSPPSGYDSLKDFQTNIGVWADQYMHKVLADIEAVGNNPYSNSAVVNLISDSQQADSLAAMLESAASDAATQAGMQNFKGLNLSVWGISAK